MESLNTDKVRDAADSAKRAVSQAADKASDLLPERGDLMATVSQATDKGLEIAKERLDFLRGETTELMHTAERAIRKNPLAAVGIAAGVGVLVAGLATFAVRGLSRS